MFLVVCVVCVVCVVWWWWWWWCVFCVYSIKSAWLSQGKCGINASGKMTVFGPFLGPWMTISCQQKGVRVLIVSFLFLVFLYLTTLLSPCFFFCLLFLFIFLVFCNKFSTQQHTAHNTHNTQQQTAHDTHNTAQRIISHRTTPHITPPHTTTHHLTPDT